MKKKIIGRVGALLMAATMTFTNGTAIFAADTVGDESQNLMSYEDDNMIEEGIGYEIEKGTPLDGGRCTAWA